MLDAQAHFDPTADLFDEDGRPIGEVGSTHYERVETELVRCPYADARHGGPMNQSALRQLGEVWSDVRTLASCVAGPHATVHRAWRAAIAGTRAPAVFAERAEGPVPRALSAWYKASLGFSQVLTALLLSDEGVADAPLDSLGEADDFLALLERDRWLVGAEQVCAGPASMIAQLFQALADARPDAAWPPSLAVLAPLDPWIDARCRWVQHQVEAVLRARVEAAAGQRTLDDPDLAPGLPCLRGVLAVPGRQPEHAARLFPA